MASFSWGDLRQAADDAGFSVVPKGDYDVLVKSAEAKKTGTGKDKIAVRFSVTSGPSEGKSLFNDFVISPESGVALGFFFRHMKALGLGPEYFATEPSFEKVATDLVGKTCKLTVDVEQWNEEDRNRVKDVKPLTGGAPMPATAIGPQPMAMPQPTAQPRPTPQPQPAAQPQPAPVSTVKTEPEDEKPQDEAAEPEDEKPAVAPAPADLPTEGEAKKPPMPF
jgi:hypothetical protein